MNIPTKESNSLGNLNKLSLEDLLSAKRRFENILTSESQLQTLSDKGQKMEIALDCVLKELQLRELQNSIESNFSHLFIEPKRINTYMVWECKLSRRNIVVKEDVTDSDDDDDKWDDIKREGSQKFPDSTKLGDFSRFDKKLFEKELKVFKLDKCDPSNAQFRKKRRNSKSHKDWENTAATPPIAEKSLQYLSLSESCVLQAENIKKMQRIMEEAATERLISKLERKVISDVCHPIEEEFAQNPMNETYPAINIEGELIMDDDDTCHPTEEEFEQNSINEAYSAINIDGKLIMDDDG
ncbi:uncharacterized protein LOC119690070 [Teleopsis dalmanni]|uniref:uncharacterized protein LOC119690070 n=1 Tax=Teleopsis dalmanni TaxID=139649 RepID=UPI0018CEA041|nr:uncharacterized protein LOC119690070 [Teleopsis dalmanni]